MGENNDTLLNAIEHYQKSLDKGCKSQDNERILYSIEKLYRLPIKVKHLEQTGVGRTVNGLRKLGGEVGEAAKGLVVKWKEMVCEVEPGPQEPSQENNRRVDKMSSESGIDTSIDDNSEENSSEDEEENVTNNDDDQLKINEETSSEEEEDDTDDEEEEEKERHVSRHSKREEEEREQHKHRSKRRDSTSSEEDRRKDSSKSHKRRKSESSDEETNRKHSKESKSKHSKHDSDRKSHHSSSSSSHSDKNKNKKSSHRESRRDEEEDSRRHHKSSSSSKSSKHRKDKSDTEEDIKKKHKSSSSSSSYKSKKRERESSDEEEEPQRKHHKSDRKEKEKKRSRSSSDEEEERRKLKEKEKKKRSRSSSDEEEERNDKAKKHKKEDKHKSSSKEDKKYSHNREDSKKSKHSSEKDSNKHRSSSSASSSSKHDSKKEKDSRSEDSKSSKSESKSKEKSEKKPDKDKHKSEHKSKESKNKNEPKSEEKKKNKISANGIDSGSGASFAEALGMVEFFEPSPSVKFPKKKTESPQKQSSSSSTSSSHSRHSKSEKSTKNTSNSSSSSSSDSVPKLLKEPQLEPLDINISSLLPSITPNYRPLGLPVETQSRKVISDDEALSRVISQKNQRTKVYSGNKVAWQKVPSLFEICTMVLQDNIDALEYTGGVPYLILKPILEKSNPDQLFTLEHHNPYLIEDTDELWHLHCQREFRNKQREELESWREMYMRCLDEREAKLRALTANIKQTQEMSTPVRTTKLAYVDNVAKPPRNIARKQAKNGTAFDVKRPMQTPQSRLAQLATPPGDTKKITVPNPGAKACERSSVASSSAHQKVKKAPLMAKTLSLLKNRFGRR